MPYVITLKCIECGSCESFCRNGAIDVVDGHYVIDPDKCDACGTCCEYCPIDDAIVETEAAEA